MPPLRNRIRSRISAPILLIQDAQSRRFNEALISFPERVTDHPFHDEQLLYFTSSSLTSDDRRLFFISNRTGHPNLFVRDLITGEENQLSRNSEGWLKSYVYFSGNPYRGFAKASPCLHSPSGTAYYIQGRQIMKVDDQCRPSRLNELPSDQMTGYTHVSADGKFMCIPTVDARALDGDKKLNRRPSYDIAKRVREENLISYLRVYDTQNGSEVLCEPIKGGWITHAQFSPLDSRKILYNYEWSAMRGINRIWLWDGSRSRPMRTEGKNRHREDWISHEIWTRDGGAIIYHGEFRNGYAFIGKIALDDEDPVELAVPAQWKHYGHYNSLTPNRLISDGYFRTDNEHGSIYSLWLCSIEADWTNRTMVWRPLCAHLSTWKTQDEHPHPIIDHQGRYVYFTSDKDGHRAVYRTHYLPLQEQS